MGWLELHGKQRVREPRGRPWAPRPTAALLLASCLMPRAVAAEPAGARLLVDNLRAPEAQSAAARAVAAALLQEIGRMGAEAVSKDELNAFLTHEKQQQLLGADDQGIFDRVVTALGAEFLLGGALEAGRLDPALSRPATAQVLARCSRPAADQPAALAAAAACSRELLREQLGALKPRGYAALADFRWLALRLRGDPGLRQRTFTVVLDHRHFTLEPYDALDEALPLGQYLHFPGDFPGCYGRPQPQHDAFSLASGRLGVPVPPAQSDALVRAFREGRAFVELSFGVEAARLHPMPKYFWDDCDKAGRFTPGDIAPELLIAPRAGRLVLLAAPPADPAAPDLSRGRAFGLRVVDELGARALPSSAP